MERKTIGGFIAALRRASGMTQKELADKLHVSDKTVSRWERDESTPDLSLIPAIAEIFGISCDELLRGERKPVSAQTEADSAADTESVISEKGEKQRRLLLRNAHLNYTNHTLASIAVASSALIGASGLNFKLRAVAGFFVGLSLLLCAAVLQAIYLNNALSAVSDELVSEEEQGNFRRRVIVTAERLYGYIAVLLGFILPLLIFAPDAYTGLSGKSFLLYGFIFALAAGILYALICRVVHHSLYTAEKFTMDEQQECRYRYNYRLQRICILILAGLLCVTAVTHISSTEIWGPYSLMKGQVFEDYDSFIAYMEQDIPYNRFSDTGVETAAEPVPDSVVYYDKDGNIITEEEANRRTLEDANGNVVCEYRANNKSVCSIRYAPGEETVLPITVCTYDDLRKAEAKAAVRHGVFTAVYIVEVIAVSAVYIRKRKK